MLRLIYGGFGSGKSTRINTLISESVAKRDKYKKSIYLIVPEQDTVRAELETAEVLDPSSALCFEVQNFSRLADTVFRAHGGLCYNYASPQSKALCMWQSIRSLGGLIDEPMEEADEARINSMLSVIAELRASGVELGMLERASETLGTDTPLGREMRDLSLIATVYDAKLSETYSDSEKDLDRLCGILETKRFFSGCDIYIDGFSSFTAPQINVIERLLRDADSVTVTVPCDRTRGSYAYARETEATAHKLNALALKCGCECICEDMGGSVRGIYPDIRYTADNYYRNGAEPISQAEHFSFFECSDMREEAEAVASLIKKKIIEGARYRDIAVVARNASDYAGILDAAFERHSIPCFFSSEVRAEAHPVVKLVYGAFTLYTKNCRREDVISYLKTGLCGVFADDCDLFEKYVNSWRINGKRFMSEAPFLNNPSGYTDKIGTADEYILERVNKLKEKLRADLAPLFVSFDKAGTVSEITAAIWGYLQSLDIAGQLYREASALSERGDEQGARELEGTYRCLVETLDIMAEVAGDEAVTPSEYLKLLKLCLKTKTVSVIPTSADAVTVGSAHMLRTSGIRHIFVIGAADGKFPQPIIDRGYFDDIKRSKLASVGIDIRRDVETEVSKELFYFARAVCCASESVTVFYSPSDASPITRASTSVSSLMALLGRDEPCRFSEMSVCERVYDTAGMVEMAMTSDPDAADGETRAIIELAKEGCIAPYELAEMLSPRLAKGIFGPKMTMSYSRFDCYVRCHFSYLCKYVLKLEESSEYGFDALDIGNFVHDILDRITGEMLDNGKLRVDMTREELDSRVNRIAGEYLGRVLPEDESRSARLMSLIGRIRRSVSLICDNIRRELEQSAFVPVGHELQIMKDSPINPSPLEFTVSDGVSLSLEGTIDRADIYKSGDDVYVRVIDYKTGNKDFSLDAVMAGLDLQMLIYLFTLCSQKGKEQRELLNCPEGGSILPAGMLYYSASVADVNAISPMTAAEGLAAAEKGIARRGILTDDENVLRAMERGLDGKYIAVAVKGDELKAKDKSITLVDRDAFDLLRAHTEEVIASVAGEMYAGRVEAEPLEHKGRVKCDWCEMRSVCRRYDIDGIGMEDNRKEAKASE